MPNLERLIRHELEHSALDFKLQPYENHADFLKDVIALANADVQGDRHIILGLKVYPNGYRRMEGIDPDRLRDGATYQQLVRENVEPGLVVDTEPVDVDGKLYGCFRIRDCSDPPYMMRKQFGNLQRGESWVRLGAHQLRLTRDDVDRMYTARLRDQGFTAEVHCGFDADSDPKEIQLESAGQIELPSNSASRRIRATLTERERVGDRFLPSYNLSAIIGGTVPYSERTTEQLQWNLSRVKETYAAHDLYAVCEVHATKIQLVLINHGTTHLEDARIDLRIADDSSFIVADHVYGEPAAPPLYLAPVAVIGYPAVTKESGYYTVTAEIGDLRHQVRTKVFATPLRMTFFPEAEGRTVEIAATIHGRNLREPIRHQLRISVVSPAHRTS